MEDTYESYTDSELSELFRSSNTQDQIMAANLFEEDCREDIAYLFWEIAARKGDIEAQLVMGHDQFMSDQLETAVQWFKIAAQQGCGKALNRLDDMQFELFDVNTCAINSLEAKIVADIQHFFDNLETRQTTPPPLPNSSPNLMNYTVV